MRALNAHKIGTMAGWFKSCGVFLICGLVGYALLGDSAAETGVGAVLRLLT